MHTAHRNGQIHNRIETLNTCANKPLNPVTIVITIATATVTAIAIAIYLNESIWWMLKICINIANSISCKVIASFDICYMNMLPKWLLIHIVFISCICGFISLSVSFYFRYLSLISHFILSFFHPTHTCDRIYYVFKCTNSSFIPNFSLFPYHMVIFC